MVLIRNTRQKELILKVLRDDKTHPTIKEIYNKVHNVDSTIGQATVYRNINKLVDNGKIKKLSTNSEIDHYDGDNTNHYHFVCTVCNKIIDIFDYEVKIPVNNIEKEHNISIDNFDIVLYGKCDSCK